MESETVLNDLVLSSSEDQRQLDFGDLVESQLDSLELSLSSEVNSFDVGRRKISQCEQSPAVNTNSTLSESDLPCDSESSQVSEALEIRNKSKESSHTNFVQSNKDNSSQKNKSLTAAVDSKQTKQYCIDSRPGTSSECQQDFGCETEESFASLTNQEDSFQQDKSPEKRKRSRKQREEDLTDTKPRRESQRKRKCTQIMNYEKEHTEKHTWSVKEKKELLKALEKWGPDNVKALQMELPGRSKTKIINQIKIWKELAQTSVEKRLVTEMRHSDNATVNSVNRLDEWIEHFAGIEEVSSNKLFALSNVFLLIAEYGNFPLPSESNNVDFRAMYRYIHCMLNGIPYYGLNRATAKVLNTSIVDLFALVKEYQHFSNPQQHLFSSLLRVKPRCRTYGRPSNWGTATLKNPNSIMNLPDINPLNIPPYVLAKPDVVDYECEDDDDSSDVDSDCDNNKTTN
uniref:Myb-like domain-containing protein n=2 Tax=Graphocephala atropunctata TaxID=36148 RepID=A0A1B6M8H3_9HEMI